LELLNLIHKPNLKDIDKYLEEHESDEASSITDSQANILSGALNSSKELLLDIMPAKKDRSLSLLSSRIIYKLFPEVLENIKKEKKQNNPEAINSFWTRMGFGRGSGRSGAEATDSQERHANLENRSSAGTYEGGDGGGTERGKKPVEVFKLRENISAMFANNIFGQYRDGKWSKIEFNVGKEVNTPFKEITNTLLNVGNSFNISLPKPLEARIIPERVKGIRADGTEINLNIQVNALQEVTCTSSEAVKEIVYSFKMSEAFKPLENISEKNYEKFLDSVEEKESLVEGISDLNEELEIFIYSIKDKSPKEKLIAIENYVRNNSYYDDKNSEVREMKKDKNISEVIDIMQLRAQELKEAGINKGSKKFAGVCADFALLTTSLLRKANIASGYLKGYKISGKSATTKDAHGCSFVLWPGDKGEARMVFVDGTPSGSSSEFGKEINDAVSTPSIEEREAEFEKIKAEKEKESIKTLDEIEAQFDTLSEEELKELSNGRLEEALNNLLSYNINNDNLKRITKILEAYWYSPLSKLDLSKVENSIQASSFLATQLEKVEDVVNDENKATSSLYGSELFNVLENYISRFKRDEMIEDTNAGLDVLEKIYELAKNDLNIIERKALSATMNYLRAKNIKGKTPR